MQSNSLKAKIMKTKQYFSQGIFFQNTPLTLHWDTRTFHSNNEVTLQISFCTYFCECFIF